ncbi:MAG: RluA family pseudouridine synthase [Candidatus Limiplasma sp.]|nr:RluA family pseudouridine synthase [Candidatus Limiplasma sp.]
MCYNESTSRGKGAEPITELSLLIQPSWEGQLLRRVALGPLSMSYSQFKRAKFQGQLLLDGTPVHADARVRAGQLLVIRVPEGDDSPIAPYSLPLRVPYHRDGLLIVDKPAPLPSVASRQAQGQTLENALFSYLHCPSDFVYHPVNRLDKGTSGLMTVALTAHVQQRLQPLLHTGGFQREYLALCQGTPPQEEGSISQPIAKAPGATVRRMVDPGGKPALTHYRLLKASRGRSLLLLRLGTGRTHQIRVHLSWLGCPVLGDFLYGQEDPALPGRFALHSHRLSLAHPLTGENISLESPLPPVLERLLP